LVSYAFYLARINVEGTTTGDLGSIVKDLEITLLMVS